MKPLIKFGVAMLAGISLYSCSKSSSNTNPDDGGGEVIVDDIEKDRTFTSRALFEDYTGTWCGFCPQIAYKFETLAANNPRFIFIGNHSGDDLQTKYQSTLEAEYGVISWPDAIMMRNYLPDNTPDNFISTGNILDLSDTVQVQPWLATDQSVGVSFSNGKIENNRAKGTVKIAFGKDYSETLAITILLVEKGIAEEQKNYYNSSPSGNPFYGLGNPIEDYEQDNVLREAATNILGDNIDAASTKNGKIVSKDFDFDLSKYNPSNCIVVAFVNGKKSNATIKGILNVQWTAAGTNKSFEITN